jgi:hypothetical protein
MSMTCICGVNYAEHGGKDHLFALKVKAVELATLPRGARFSHSEISPPSNVYITVEDRLRVTLANSFAGIEVDVLVRLMLPDGQVIPMLQQLKPPATRVATNFEFDLAEGFLLDVNVTTPTAGVRRGACFADVTVIRGSLTNALPVLNLVDAYVTTNGNQGWPVADNTDSILGDGLLRSIQIGNPVAGADWSQAVPVGARWEVISISAQLATAVAAGNRAPAVQVTDGAAHTLSLTPFAAVQAASLTELYSAAEGAATILTGSVQSGSLPRKLKLLQGWTIGTLTAGILGADQWSNINLSVLEWIEA